MSQISTISTPLQYKNFQAFYRGATFWNDINKKHSAIKNIDEYDNVNAVVKKAIKTTTFKDFVFL